MEPEKSGQGSSVISPVRLGNGIVALAMTHFPRPNPTRRAPRVQLGGSVAAAIQLDDGERARAHLKTISTTGGVLHIGQALEDGNLVEIAFQTRSGPVHAMAEMLHPTRKVVEGGILQPFRFIALGDDDHRKLHMALTAVLDRNFVGIHAVQSATL
jgi:hypothetical protein